MVRAQAQALIVRPTDSVFNFIAVNFFKNYPRWSPEVVELHISTKGPIRVGTTGRQVRVDQGRRTESAFRVCRFEQDSCVAFQGISSPFYVSYQIKPIRNNTHLTFTFELSQLELHMRPFQKVIRFAIQEGAEGVVRNLKALIETEVPSTGTQAQHQAT